MKGELHDCIYCLEKLPADSFNREHVLSKAFADFRDVPKLEKAVCQRCNQFMGDTLEVYFTRCSLEGMLRYEHGLKDLPTEPVLLPNVELTIPSGQAWSGVRLALIQENGGIVVEALNQVAFFQPATRKWIHITEYELERQGLSGHKGLDLESGKILRSAEGGEKLIHLLSTLGVTFGRLDPLKPPEMSDDHDSLIAVASRVNDIVRRCIAKYSFNFLAFVAGKDFVLTGDFAPIRDFIRHGVKSAWPQVLTHSQPVLFDDFPELRQTNGHLLTANWRGMDLIGRVSLFNLFTYDVELCKDYSGLLWRPIQNGVCFNVAQRRVDPLRYAPSIRVLARVTPG